MKWYEPENLWDIYGITNRAEFVEEFVVVGKFHKNVPEDIINSFETVSYLLAHSYYHWPMFDEAFSKALLIMEMAVKLKAQELGIDLELPPNKKGVIYDKKLSKLINEISTYSELSFLKSEFYRAKKLRNTKVHPKSHTFMGALGFPQSNAQLFVNVINMLFMTKEQLINMHEKTAVLRNQLEYFSHGLHILEFNNKKILTDGFFHCKYREFKNNKLLLVFINPLTTKVNEQFTEKKYPEPLIVTFKDFTITEKSIEGIDLEGKLLKIHKDNKPENLNTYHNYSEALSKISESDIHIFNQSNSSRALWQMEKVIFENCWNE